MRKNENRLVPGPIVYWGDIVGNINDQEDLIEYIRTHGGGGSSEAVWGSITGEITDQGDLTDYVSTALSGYATEDWVTAQSYLVESDLSQYATRQWVTSRDYATETYVDEKTVQYDNTIEIGDSDIEDSVDVLKREVDEDGLTKQLVLGYKVIDDGVYDTIVLNDGHGSGELRLGRQEMSVEVDSGTGERTIVKGEFRPYYEIEDGLTPVTSEENEMTELAGDLKYIPYDKDDCSRILVGLNTSEYGWTGLMVNDEGQAGLYTCNIETDAETQEPVLVDDFFPYLTEGDFKTVNGQSIVGDGDITVSGGLTPEQEEAIAPLEETSAGSLYTMVLQKYVGQLISSEGPIYSDWNSKIYNVDGDVYLKTGYDLFKWNPDTFEFDYFKYINDYSNGYPIWKDNSGRWYNGVYQEMDIENGTLTDVTLNCTNYTFSGNIDSIWKGQYGIYHLRSSQKFDEDNQRFDSWTVTIDSPWDLGTIGSCFGLRSVEYDGHIIATYGPDMFELNEYEDHVEISYVDDPYFPLEIDSNTINGRFLFNISGDLFYLYSGNSYKLVNGDWERIECILGYSGFHFTYLEGHGVIVGDLLIGFSDTFNEGRYDILTVTEDISKTYWAPTKQFAVDLSSNQTIGGEKRFSSVIAGVVSRLTELNCNDRSTFYLNKNQTRADSIKIDVDGEFSVNNKDIATVDECILNSTILPYGSKYVDVYDTHGNYNPYHTNWWTTHTGRLFYGSDMEFDGTQLNYLSTAVVTGYFDASYVVKTENNTFYNYGGNTYLWDDANSAFTLIASNCPGSSQWDIWPCGGDTLRYFGTHKLVNNGGTWSWENDQLQTYYGGMAYEVDGDVFVLDLNGDNVYMYDESTKTYTSSGHYHNWSSYSFSAFGEIFYIYNGDQIWKINFSELGGSDYYVDEKTSIPVGEFDFFYGSYGDYLYFFREYSKLAYCYDAQYELPEVPATNGTYVLQAYRDGDEITYEWVAQPGQ